MKKGFLYGSILVIIGFCMLVVASVIGGYRMFELEDERVEKTYTFSGDYREINYTDMNSSILIKESPDDNVHFIAYENEDEYYQITEGDVLTINYVGEDEMDWQKNIFTIHVDFDEYRSELYIPVSMEPKLVLDNKNGHITIQDLVFTAIDVLGKNGHIKVENVTTIEDFKLETKNGNVDIEEVKAKGFDVTNKNGNINIDTVDSNDVAIENKNGSISVSNVYSNTDFELYSKNGNIKLDNIDFQGFLEASNENGTIKANLPGSVNDYSFDFKTTHGTKTLNGDKIEADTYGTGSKVVEIRNTNGNIEINTEN